MKTLLIAFALVLSIVSAAHGAELAPIAGRYVIDVRSQEEWDKAHMAGAILIPHTEIGARIESVIPARDAPISLYCGSGKRAGKALESLRAMGYSNLENLGGIEDARVKIAKRVTEAAH